MSDDQPARRARGAAVSSAVVASLLVIGGIVWLGVVDKSRSTPPAAAAVSGPSCTWTPADATQNPDLTKTGTPPTKNLPASGTRDMTLATSQGTITVKLDVTHAPCSAASFAYLASQRFFDGTTCNRMTTTGIFVLQCGDPSGKGTGGPSYTYAHENLPTGAVNYPAGTVAMANAGDPDGNGSQFFIVYKDTPTDPSTGQSVLPSNYTVIGTISTGLDIVQKVAKAGTDNANAPGDGAPKLPVNITSLTVGPVVAG
ncbi:MAG TPA: peptidylprolyl isomerase [Micromonosporaceae bacterium]|jgi:peptidyl-prolyl cis-trans isomerase B (cyclophilin B)|nr:peptidylprolyl isomerase [Micromonosporaceae bacterium]